MSSGAVRRLKRQGDGMKQVVAPVMESETRQKIISLLYSAPQGPTQIARTLGFSQSYISNHLTFLKSHQLVTSRRHGRTALYELEGATRKAMTRALAGMPGPANAEP